MTKAKKMLAWMAALFACVLLLFIAMAVLLHTDFAHRYVLRLVTQGIQNSIGGRAEIESVSFHRGHLGADFYGLKIHGTEPDSEIPLLSADRIAIDFGLHLFGSPKLAIENVTLDHPVVNLTVDSKGNSNLPGASKSSSQTSTDAYQELFDVAVGHLVVNAGEILYNDRRVPIAADVRNLDARAVFQTATMSYDAALSYRDSVVRYGDLTPFAHDLQLSVSAAPSGLSVKSLRISSGSSWVKVQGRLVNYAAPSLDGSFEASLATAQLAKAVTSSSVAANPSIAGQVDTKGTFAYRPSAAGPSINNVSLDGSFNSRALGLKLSGTRAAAQNVTGEYRLHQGVLEVSKVEADTFGGHAAGRLMIRDISMQAAAQLDASAQGISLAAIRDAVAAQNLTQIRVNGRLAGKVHASWHGSVKDLQLLSDATIAGSVSSDVNTSAQSGSFPIQGAVHVAYNAPRQVLTFQDTFVKTPHSRFAVNGVLASDAKLQIDGSSDDLREIDLLVLAFRPNTPTSNKDAADRPPQLLGLTGTANIRGTVSGRPASPRFAGQFSATNLQLRNVAVQSLHANIEARPTEIAARQGTIRTGSQSQASFDVSSGLRDWQFAPDQPLMAHVTTNKLSIADLEHIAGIEYPISGVLAANVTVTGTGENPSAEGNLHLTQGELWQQPVQNIDVEFKSAGDRIVTTVNLESTAGSATSTISYGPKNQDYDLQANLQGLRLNQIQYMQAHAQQVTGVLSVAVQGRGNIKEPQMALNVSAQQLKIGEQAIDGFTVQASVSQRRASFDIKGSVSGAALQAQGTADLTGNYQANAQIDSGAIQLGAMLASFLPQGGADFYGETQFHGTLAGPLKNPDQLEMHVQMPKFDVGYRQIQLTEAAPIHVDYQKGVLTVQHAEFKGTGTDLTLDASVPTGVTENLQAAAKGKLDLSLLQIWNPEWQSSGQVTLNLDARGLRSHPELSGAIAVSDGAIAMESAPALEKIKGELDISGERIQVRSLTGQLGGGDFEVHGFALYRPGIQYNLGMTARNVILLYPDGVRTQLTANLNFAGRPDAANLTGQVSIDRLSFTQSFDLAAFSNTFGGPSAPGSGMAENVKLNVAVSSTQELELTSSQLSLQGTADFRVRGTLAEPVLIGRTDLTGGELFFNAKRFEIQNASIVFANPVRTEPIVNLSATTTVDQFNLTVNLVGPFDRLRTTYTSDPPLPPVDVINLLITGQTTEAAQGSTASPQSVIAGQLTGQVSNRLQKLTGISSLTIDPQIGGNQGNAASQLAIQERVTKNLFFTFATDVTTTQGVVVQVEYQVTPRYSMSAVRDQTGGYEIEIKAHKKF